MRYRWFMQLRWMVAGFEANAIRPDVPNTSTRAKPSAIYVWHATCAGGGRRDAVPCRNLGGTLSQVQHRELSCVIVSANSILGMPFLDRGIESTSQPLCFPLVADRARSKLVDWAMCVNGTLASKEYICGSVLSDTSETAKVVTH